MKKNKDRNSELQKQNSESCEINRQMVERITRDICGLYNQLTEYNYIMGDLDYSNLYNLPYWEFLMFDETDLNGENFVRDGCLVMILAMAWDYIDGSGNYILPYISSCKMGLSKIVPFDDKTEKLVNTVKLSLEIVEEKQPETAEIGQLSAWVYKEYVEGYFRKRVSEFRQ